MSNLVAANHLEKMRGEFQKVLPAHITPDKLVRSVLNSLRTMKDANSVDLSSIMQSAMTAAVLGLEVDNALGQAYIVPFKERGIPKAQLIVGYKGYITLAKNNGYIVSAEVVREKDSFNYSLGLNPVLEHTPPSGNIAQRGDITHAYAVARHAEMPPIFKVLDTYEINQRKKNTPVWREHYPAMCKKTAVRALASSMPLNVQRANTIEEMHERGESAYIDITGNVVSHHEENKTSEQPALIGDEA